MGQLQSPNYIFIVYVSTNDSVKLIFWQCECTQQGNKLLNQEATHKLKKIAFLELYMPHLIQNMAYYFGTFIPRYSLVINVS